jgi:hypothetical protein
MHLLQRLLALTLIATFSAQAAVVYKWVDADGIVHYSDQPAPGSEKIVTSAAPGRMGTVSVAAPALGQAAREPAPTAPTAPAIFAILAPNAEQTFVNEPVPVRLDFQPGLGPGEVLSWTLNGQLLADQSGVQFSLPNLPRGAYNLSATLVDPVTRETISTTSVTFYVQQPSIFSPQHK